MSEKISWRDTALAMMDAIRGVKDDLKREAEAIGEFKLGDEAIALAEREYLGAFEACKAAAEICDKALREEFSAKVNRIVEADIAAYDATRRLKEKMK